MNCISLAATAFLSCYPTQHASTFFIAIVDQMLLKNCCIGNLKNSAKSLKVLRIWNWYLNRSINFKRPNAATSSTSYLEHALTKLILVYCNNCATSRMSATILDDIFVLFYQYLMYYWKQFIIKLSDIIPILVTAFLPMTIWPSRRNIWQQVPTVTAQSVIK